MSMNGRSQDDDPSLHRRVPRGMHRQMPARHVGGEGGVDRSLNIFFLNNVFSPESLQYCQILLIFNHLTHFQPFSTLDDSFSMCW
jgi:hypothetical protein